MPCFRGPQGPRGRAPGGIQVSKRCYPLLALALALLLCFALPLGAAASDSTDPQEVQVPFAIELSGAIAGAAFEI